MDDLPVCNYEGSDYQTSFWERGGRAYEDAAEAVALRRLMPPGGKILLEVGAGAGRNTPRYHGFEQIVLLDYSRTQLAQARQRLGERGPDGALLRYVAADVYRLPFVDGLFDSTTMIRILSDGTMRASRTPTMPPRIPPPPSRKTAGQSSRPDTAYTMIAVVVVVRVRTFFITLAWR